MFERHMRASVTQLQAPAGRACSAGGLLTFAAPTPYYVRNKHRPLIKTERGIGGRSDHQEEGSVGSERGYIYIMCTRALTDYFRQRFHGTVSGGKHGASSQLRWIGRRGTNYLRLGMYLVLCLYRKIQSASLRGLERVCSVSLCSVFFV